MKKNIFISLALLLGMTATAQSQKQKLTITTKLGKVHTYIMGESMDSLRILKDVGIKVYPKGKKVSKDYLFSQITYTLTNETTPTPDPSGKNVNRNTAADLKKNREGWRLEFPRFYQGTNNIYEVTHSTTEGGERMINYSVEWDGTLKANRWTCYEMYDKMLLKKVKRTDDFKQDPDIPSNVQTTLNDYKDSGFARGHLCPSGDRLYSLEQNEQTFYLSNMQPQIQGHNGGVWQRLEAKVRSWAGKCDTLYVVKAATIDKAEHIYTNADLNEIAEKEGEVAGSLHFPGIVPKYFYMALLAYDKKTNTYRALGIWSPHYKKSPTEYITIEELQNRTGIDFFCNLDDDIEKAVESTKDHSYWGIKTSSRLLFSSKEKK
ncbi:DNA/RNA non-specific endonuclease [Prevotella intermedia]|uniref:Nuclease n=1 Tax=Prevotella intermedia TaxID=28131 RepID=A0A2G8I7Q9_PREIN|nr:DNA/RNA non-specific endonuclease [Prevotella intermedia]PIK19457.1 nuclease [Prevotella intermedia]